MIFTGLVIAFLLVCTVIGTFLGERATRPWVAAALAAAMVAVQFTLLTGR